MINSKKNKMSQPVKDRAFGLLPIILIEFNKAVKALSLYPSHHPSMKTILESSYTKSLESVATLKEVTFSVKRNGFFYNEQPVVDNPSIKNLANEFYQRRIKKITLSSTMTVDEWNSLLSIFNLTPAKLLKDGGAERLLAENGVKGIWLNEIRYEDIVEKAVDVEEKEDEKADEAEIPETEPEALKEDTKEETEPLYEEDLELSEDGKNIDELLASLEKEKDPLVYEGLVRTIVGIGMTLKEEWDTSWNKLLQILYVFARHSYYKSRRPEEQKVSSKQALKDLFDKNILEKLLNKLIKKGEKKRKEIGGVILCAGNDFVPYILNRLIKEEDIYARRSLFNLIVAMGNYSRTEVEKNLAEHKEWYIKRQMISILGAIGSPASFKTLKDALGFDDIRVTREVIKALASIKSKECINELIELTSARDHTISLQAILTLGAIKTHEAVPYLTAITITKGLSRNIYEKKKAAIKALGNIGSPEALRELSIVLNKKRWWRKRLQDELRGLSASSIGMIGGEEAKAILTETLGKSKGALYHTCLKAIEKIGE